MALGVRRGDEVVLSARGAAAARALAAVEAALHAVPAPRTPRLAPAMNSPTVRPSGDGVIRGVVASRGLAVGQAVHLTRPEPRVTESGRGVAEEEADLSRARAAVKVRIQALAAAASGTTQEVLEAHVAFLDDRTLVDRAHAWIVQGKSAGFAWRQSVNETVADLRGVGDERLRERVDDLNDLATQVLLALAGKIATVALPERAIVLADELLPSQFVALPRERIAGICVGGGGATSHVAILAAAKAIPMIVAAGPAILAVADGSTVVLDAEAGLLLTAPSDTEIRAAEHTVAERRARHTAALKDARVESRTADGVRIEMFANVGSVAEARDAIEQGAEGCGLLRSEFLFLERATPPSEGYQTQQYQSIAEAFSGLPLVVRTLDAGGDKPIEYLPLPAEENPALGLRGVRTSLWRPDLLRTQLRAILAVRPAGQCRVLLPMVTSSDEIRSVRALLDEEQAALGLPVGCPLGIMIETPAAALSAGSLAAHADFLSIGTNDLTQYTLAMDRGHAQLAEQLDALHPAVLQLIAATVAGARRHNRRVSVCGGLASDPAAAPILIGLGVEGLSAVPAVIAQLKSLIRTLRTDECRALAARALQQESAAAVRSLTVSVLKAVP
jgi:phosphocarrier protein FPr/phosphocarrier protein